MKRAHAKLGHQAVVAATVAVAGAVAVVAVATAAVVAATAVAAAAVTAAEVAAVAVATAAAAAAAAGVNRKSNSNEKRLAKVRRFFVHAMLAEKSDFFRAETTRRHGDLRYK
jgi:hypothetical protein